MSFEMSLKSPELRRSSAIIELAPKCSFNSESDGTITKWLTPDIPQPSEADINAKVTEYKIEWDAEEYARKRQKEYPSIAELTVALYDTDDKAALETKRAVVKTKWPKDNSGPVE